MSLLIVVPGSLSKPPGTEVEPTGETGVTTPGVAMGAGADDGGNAPNAPVVKAIDCPVADPINAELCLSDAVAYVCPFPPVKRPMLPSTRRRTCGAAGERADPLL